MRDTVYFTLPKVVISTSNTRKPLIMKAPVSSGLYRVVVISYSLQYDIIYILIL